ncbi:MAG: cobalamin-dependent protein [Syntrophales bacterium]|nr:cobalamin-dependent protein [Syntrophales bacterium]
MKEKKIRMLLTIARFDGHDRGVRHLARKLRDFGMEVIFTRFVYPRDVVSSAIQEDVDVVGVSFSVGGHKSITSEIIKGLRESKREDILVIVGGVVPDDDVPELISTGVGRTFGPGSSAADIAQYIKDNMGNIKD